MKTELQSIIDLLLAAEKTQDFNMVHNARIELESFLNDYLQKKSNSGSKTTEKKAAASRKNFAAARKTKEYLNNSADREKAEKEIRTRKASKHAEQGFLFDDNDIV